ncbi:MAG: histidine--tRNA ligase [Bacteroidales bacterium]|nr:histidine--tRNA ligase [Bacteroidales bacterium]
MRGIVPQKVKGFRDITSSQNALRELIISKATEVYRRFGFSRFDTPVLEYAECLGKYLPDADSVAQGVYSFKNPEQEPVFDTEGREMRDADNNVIMENHYVAMRYDLTAPLARVYAESLWQQHLRGEIQGKTNLFRRYQYGPVYRFEAKLDPGRFREFWQMDFDTVGAEDVSADAENCIILSQALENIGLKRGTYLIKINNRKIVNGLLAYSGITDKDEEMSVMRIIDKLDKIGIDAVAQELGGGRVDEVSGAQISGLGLDAQHVDLIINYIKDFEQHDTRRNVIEKLKSKPAYENDTYKEGVIELELIDHILADLGYDEQVAILDPGMVRGLGYYTGPIYEVESLQTYKDAKGRERRVGSICGGGRYDGLVENLLHVKVPATGASIGVDRLAELLTLTGQVPEQIDGAVIVIVFDDDLMPLYQKTAMQLRAAGIDTEVYYGAKRGLKHQMAYADRNNCPLAIIIGGDEAAKGVASVKNLKLGKQLADTITDKNEWKQRVQKEIPLDILADEIKKMLTA